MGFNQSHPFLEDGSDAACRVVHVIFAEVLNGVWKEEQGSMFGVAQSMNRV